MAKCVKENLNLLAAINVCSSVIQGPALLVQRWSQLLVTVRKQNPSLVDAVPRNGPVSRHVGGSCFVDNINVKILVMQEVVRPVQELVGKSVSVANK